MKKYVLAIAALIMFAGISNAQLEKKEPANSSKQVSMKTKTPPTGKTVTSTSNVTPTTAAHKQTVPTGGIKRKHHHKKTASPKKTKSK